jgi:hypothetical protein
MRTQFLPELDREVTAIQEYCIPGKRITLWDAQPDGYIVAVVEEGIMSEGKANLFPTYAQASDVFAQCIENTIARA